MSEREDPQRERGRAGAGLALGPGGRPEKRALRAVVSDPLSLAGRGVRALLRQPWFVAVTLVQPVVWLLLFGALFENVVPSPTGDYIAYLTPGIAVMTALFSSGWAGMGFITDAERGVLDRLLVSPVRRGSVMTGSLLYQQVTTVVQTLVILGWGWPPGPGSRVGSWSRWRSWPRSSCWPRPSRPTPTPSRCCCAARSR